MGLLQNVLLLYYPIHPLGLQDLFRFEPVIKNSKPAANDSLGLAVPATHSPGKSETWRPIAAIMDVALRLEPQA